MTSHQAPGPVAGVLTEVWVVGRVMPQLVLRQVVRHGSGGLAWPRAEEGEGRGKGREKKRARKKIEKEVADL